MKFGVNITKNVKCPSIQKSIYQRITQQTVAVLTWHEIWEKIQCCKWSPLSQVNTPTSVHKDRSRQDK